MSSLEIDPEWIAPGQHLRPLILEPAAHQAIRRLAAHGYPFECCGLLVGQEDRQSVQALAAHVARNLEQERREDRFQLDPADHLRIEREAESQGLSVIGTWHSHPDHPAQPSRTDFSAAWPGWSYLIVSVGAEGTTDLRSWRLDATGRFQEEPLELRLS